MRRGRFAIALITLAAWSLLGAAGARAQTDWRLEQPPPPEAASGAKSTIPIGLGHVGAISFAAPNRGVLITAGNPPTIPPGVWFYNGSGWRELSDECGATDGRIAWAADTQNPHVEEFWTVSDGRPGQSQINSKSPPITDNTLCRFQNGKVIESFAAPAFEAGSYVPMHAAWCLTPVDCWFGGDSLPEENPEIGAFQLHWNGSTLSEEPYRGEAHAIEEMQQFDGRLYESVQLLQSDAAIKNVGFPPSLHVLDSEAGTEPFAPEGKLAHETLYAPGKLPWSLGYLHLSAGASGLWAAAGQRPESEEAGTQATVLRFTPESGGEWRQVLGPSTSPSGEMVFPEQTVESLAAEPGGGEEEAAWLALQSNTEALETERGTPRSSTAATLARITPSGALSSETLPSKSETGVGPKGAAEKIVCPQAEDCWMTTTEGWLFHYAPEAERTLPAGESTFSGAFISERPADQGLPQTQPDTLPEDSSGDLGEISAAAIQKPKHVAKENELRVPVPLVSKVHTKLRGTTLEMRFHLAVKARVRLVAKRKKLVVARSPMRTFAAGTRALFVKLQRKRWPTQLKLQEKALAPLPTVPEVASNQESVVTSTLRLPSHLAGNALELP